jgi:transposase
MHKLTIIGVDLAKHVIQVSIMNTQGKEVLNRTISRAKFSEFITKQKPSLFAFEACASSHY